MPKEKEPTEKKKRGVPKGLFPGVHTGFRKVVLEEEDYPKIEMMSGLGMTVIQISALLGICSKTLERMSKEDEKLKVCIEQGRSKAILKVSRSAFELASSGKNPDMTKFYLRCRAGWKEKVEIESTVKQEVTFVTKIGDDGVVKMSSTDKDALELDEFGL